MSHYINDISSTIGVSKQGASSFLAFFMSTSTLLCCALPATIAAVAGGASVTSLASTFPWLIPLSANKEWIFLGTGLMILFSAILVLRPKGAVACRITGGVGCEAAGRFTKIMLGISGLIYGVGLFSAYLLVPILRVIDA